MVKAQDTATACSARLGSALQIIPNNLCRQNCLNEGLAQRQNGVNLKLDVRVCITYHSRCTGKRKEPISTCPAPFKIHSYACSSSLPALSYNFFLLFLQLQQCEKMELQISSPLSAALPSLSFNPARWEKDEEEEVRASSCF